MSYAEDVKETANRLFDRAGPGGAWHEANEHRADFPPDSAGRKFWSDVLVTLEACGCRPDSIRREGAAL